LKEYNLSFDPDIILQSNQLIIAICDDLKRIAKKKGLKEHEQVKAIYLEKESIPEMMVLQRAILMKQYTKIMEEMYQSLDLNLYGHTHSRRNSIIENGDEYNNIINNNNLPKFRFFRGVFFVLLFTGLALYMTLIKYCK